MESLLSLNWETWFPNKSVTDCRTILSHSVSLVWVWTCALTGYLLFTYIRSTDQHEEERVPNHSCSLLCFAVHCFYTRITAVGSCLFVSIVAGCSIVGSLLTLTLRTICIPNLDQRRIVGFAERHLIQTHIWTLEWLWTQGSEEWSACWLEMIERRMMIVSLTLHICRAHRRGLLTANKSLRGQHKQFVFVEG